MRTSPALTDDELAFVSAAPTTGGTVALIVARPEDEARRVLDEGELTPVDGLVGDNWATRGGTPMQDCQITLMSSRAATLIAGEEQADWPPAGDQFYVDFDLSVENLPPGTRLALGSAEVEITAEPHLGCGKFARRFGVAALKLVNSETGRALRLRGVNAYVTRPGTVRPGDAVVRLENAA